MAADTIVAAFVDSMRQTVLAVLDSIHSKITWDMTVTDASRIKGYMGNLTPADSIESLWVTAIGLVADLYSSMGTVPDSSKMASLEDMASLCPMEYGPAVYMAREALNAVDSRPRLFINECEALYPPQPPSQRLADPGLEKEAAQGIRVSVNPNPAENEVTVTIDPWDENGHFGFELLDALGRPMLRSVLTSDRNQLSVPFASGMYLNRVTDFSGKNLTHGRLVIIRP